jgi:hypothetical protein
MANHEQVGWAGERVGRSVGSLTLLLSLWVPAVLVAHHSGSEYDRTTVEVEGTLVELSWRNPHVHFGVRTTDKDGKAAVWDIEANSVSILSRTDANPDNLKVGDRIKVAGAPSRRTPNKMWASNILPANGREVVLGPGTPPRWGTTAVGSKSTWFEGGTDADKAAGIFRVWSTKFGEPGGVWWRRDYPLTDAAKKKRAAFNPLTDTVAPGCKPKGMPTIMEQPYPLEFVRKGDTVLLRLEEYDTVRTIDMKSASGARRPKTLLGHSQGRWEGDTLVVTTTGIAWTYFDPSGVPLGPSASIVERFTPSADGTRLILKMTVTDPDTFTQPVDLQRTWVWRRGETVKPYACVERKTASR